MLAEHAHDALVPRTRGIHKCPTIGSAQPGQKRPRLRNLVLHFVSGQLVKRPVRPSMPSDSHAGVAQLAHVVEGQIEARLR